MAIPQERQLLGWPGVVNFAVGRQIISHYLIRRLLKTIVTVFLVSSFTFFLVRLMPSNPVDAYIQTLIQQQHIPYEQARSQAAALFSIDLKAPLQQQYLSYLGNLAHGDLGTSLVNHGMPVGVIILHYLPWTVFSVGAGLIISFVLGIIIGMLMAYTRGSVFDNIISAFASMMSSVPNYVIGILILVFLGARWGIIDISSIQGTLSPGMRPELSLDFVFDAFYHASLPILIYVMATTGGWMLTMRSSTESTLHEDYVTVARARGLKEQRILASYVGRNALLPLVTQLALSIGFAVGGSVLIESLFTYQGLGLTLLSAINQRDYPVMQGIFLVITIIVVLSNLVADLLYARLDPRIRLT